MAKQITRRTASSPGSIWSWTRPKRNKSCITCGWVGCKGKGGGSCPWKKIPRKNAAAKRRKKKEERKAKKEARIAKREAKRLKKIAVYAPTTYNGSNDITKSYVTQQNSFQKITKQKTSSILKSLDKIKNITDNSGNNTDPRTLIENNDIIIKKLTDEVNNLRSKIIILENVINQSKDLNNKILNYSDSNLESSEIISNLSNKTTDIENKLIGIKNSVLPKVENQVEKLIVSTIKQEVGLLQSFDIINTANIGNKKTSVVGTNGGPSSYGTYDQTGNVWELTDGNRSTNNNPLSASKNGLDAIRLSIRGGSYNIDATDYELMSNEAVYNIDSIGYQGDLGFRVASSSNPQKLDMVAIRDPGNNGKAKLYDGVVTSVGSVPYNYQIGTYPITVCEYAIFLNSIVAVITAGANIPFNIFNILYPIINNKPSIQNIRRPTVTRFSIVLGTERLPITNISWLAAARYCNWLHNGRHGHSNLVHGTPGQNWAPGVEFPEDQDVTENGAYNIAQCLSSRTIIKNENALYWIPTESEWYKAAYYKSGATKNEYWKYATQSNEPPASAKIDASNRGSSSKIAKSFPPCRHYSFFQV